MPEKSVQEYDQLFDKLQEYYKLIESQKEKPNAEIDRISNELSAIIGKKKRKAKWESRITWMGIILLVIGLLALFWADLEIHVIFGLRFILVLLAPIFDVTAYLNNEQCILSNPSFVPESRISEKMCENACHKNNEPILLNQFAHNLDFNQSLFNQYVFESEIPIIETTEVGQWSMVNEGTDSILSFYFDNLETLSENDFCIFEASKDLKLKSPIDLVKNFNANKPESYYAMWENCGKASSKLIKKLIQRPSFFPKSIEMLPNSWLFISNQYAHENYTPIPVMQRIVLFCQIKGESEVVLTPVEACKKDCVSHVIHLEEGQIGVFTDMWIIDFKVASNLENIVLILMAQ